MPVIEYNFQNLTKLKQITLKEKLESNKNKRESYMGSLRIDIDIKVLPYDSDSEVNFVLDYDHYTFNFSQLVKILIENKFKKVDAIIYCLTGLDQNILELF